MQTMQNPAIYFLQSHPLEETLWDCIIKYQGWEFRTYSGLPFTYHLKRGRDGEYTRELWINRRENSKSLSWSSIMIAFRKTEGKPVFSGPKSLGNIRGISYIYGIFYQFGLISVPAHVEKKMNL